MSQVSRDTFCEGIIRLDELWRVLQHGRAVYIIIIIIIIKSSTRSGVLQAVMPNRVFQHIMTRTYNFLHSTAIFVDLEGWYNSHILSSGNCRACLNIHLSSNTKFKK